MAAQGLTTIKSSYSPEQTLGRLEAAIAAKGLTVFARIDHAAGANAAGLSLRPTEVLIFGNARGGNAVDAGGPDNWDRPAAQGFGLAGRSGRNLAFLQ